MSRLRAVLLAIGLLTTTGLIATARAESPAPVASDYYQAGDKIVVPDQVVSDAIVAGTTVTSDGHVTGDILAAAQTVEVGGHVGGNLRLAGGDVTINGDVGRNVTILSGQVTAAQESHIHGNAVVVANDVTLSGPIDGNLEVVASNVTLSGTIGGNVRVRAGQLTLSSSAVIHGNLVYDSDHVAKIDGGAMIAGTTTRHNVTTPAQAGAIKAGYALWLLMTELLLGLFVMVLMPILPIGAARELQQRPWQSFAVGLMALLLVPVLVAIIAATLVGLPLALLIGLMFVLALMLSHVVAAVWLGSLATNTLKWKRGQVREFALGAALIWFMSLLPGIGASILLALAMAGLGSIIVLIVTSGRKFHHDAT